eukprot:154255-Pyramimonas_sp.AAC.1
MRLGLFFSSSIAQAPILGPETSSARRSRDEDNIGQGYTENLRDAAAQRDVSSAAFGGNAWEPPIPSCWLLRVDANRR